MQTDLTGRDLDAAVSFHVYGEPLYSSESGRPWTMPNTEAVAAYRADPPRHDPWQVVEDCRKRGLWIWAVPMHYGWLVTDGVPGVEKCDGDCCTFADLRETILRAAVRLCSESPDRLGVDPERS